MNTKIDTGCWIPSRSVSLWPSKVLWDISYRCNMKCKYCLADAGPECKDEITALDAVKVAKILIEGGVTHFTLMGGEPLYFPGITDIIETIVNNGRFAQIVTNGILLDDNNIFRFINSKVEGIKSIQLSLHNINDINYYAKIIERYSTIGIPVYCLIVIYKSQVSIINDIYHAVASSGATNLYLTAVSQIGRASDEKDSEVLSTSELVQMTIDLNKIRMQKNYKTIPTFKHRGMVSDYCNKKFDLQIDAHRCNAAISEMHILPDTRCQPCPFIPGNLKDKYTTKPLMDFGKLSNVWGSENFEAFRKEMGCIGSSNASYSCKKCKFNLSGKCSPCLLGPSDCASTVTAIAKNIGK